MNRKDFLKGLGITGAGAFFLNSLSAGSKKALDSTPPNCTLIPSETAGPFPLDLTANNYYFRQDVREDREGVQLNLKMKIIGADNCEPMQNLRVNIWHCDRVGNYSGYQSEEGETYLRGYQITDDNGEVEFVTIFPGWYNGRICHIHFQVYVSSVYSAVSQLAFPTEEKNAIYDAYPDIYTKGEDPLNFNQDNIFSDGYALQLATLTPNATTGGYDSYLEVTVQGSGVTGLINHEPETGGQFKLFANYPNPFSSVTSIPFELLNAAHVKLELFDLNAKKVMELLNEKLSPGNHKVVVNRNANGIGLPSGNYAYKIEVENSHGLFKQMKLLTVQ